MPTPIEDYALLSDCRTAALVSRDGSIDWFCAPRYDSPSIFGALLGDAEHGHWMLRPADPDATSTRRYDGDTFVLVTRWQTATGVAEVHEFLAADEPTTTLIRRIRGVSGSVEFAQTVRFRFDYARARPWVRQVGTKEAPALLAAAGPEAVVVRGARLRPIDHAHHGTSTVGEGDTIDLSMIWFPSYTATPDPVDADALLEDTWAQWSDWAATISHRGVHQDRVIRSLLVLRALTHADTGGIVAAATTSLPEAFGGSRNWDYRYVWLRDAALTLEALTDHGFLEPADHWRQWLLRAIAGDAKDTQIMYGIAGERDLTERELTSLPGYGGAAPVRVGNGAVGQYQADVAGEVFVALEAAKLAGLADDPQAW
ncbi:MAG: glycoside hydrolase family 15 protein, partial [Actinobacteria bacterium]|nr:glycoside hydrolase family 15 protein [Actinomycetota bacterium]